MAHLMSMHERFESLWAKSSDRGGLPLVRHLLDVAAVAATVTTLLPASTRRTLALALSLHEDEAARWLSVLVGLHDLGKATPGFQSKWPEGRAQAHASGFVFPVAAPDRHDAATLALLPGELLRRVPQIPRESARLLADSVAAHHGHRVPLTESIAFSPIEAPALPPWSDAQHWLVDVMFDVIEPPGVPAVPSDERPLLWQLLAGLCSFCDWVGSSETFFPHDRPRLGYAAWFEQSCELAVKALEQIGFSAGRNAAGPDAIGRIPRPLEAALPTGARPRPLQGVVAELLADAREPCLVIIEAPMGEGKTEAAFAAYATLCEAVDHRGLYVAMPTQATSNAMFTRVGAFLGRLQRRTSETLQLVHGGADFADARLRLREIGFGAEDSAVHVSSWFSGSRKALLAPNAVGTIDQALVSVLNARHAFVRMFGLAGRFVLLDEVHAYDDYTGDLLERLVGWLAPLGCSVVVMSATLPEAKRIAVARAWRRDALLPSLEYPRVTVLKSDTIDARSFEPARRQQVRIKVAPDSLEGIADLAAQLVASGGCALVVANTVGRAQGIYRAVSKHATVERVLFHARFPFEERLDRERLVLKRFGPNGTARDRVVVVGTQVVEQSLDVDFDVVISDLAPIDLLLQRVGRLHRHARDRPKEHREAVLYVAGLGSVGVPAEEPRRVYEHWPVLRTAAQLRALNRMTLPSDIDRLVQEVYGDFGADSGDAALDVALTQAKVEYTALTTHQSELASQSALPLPEHWIGWAGALPIADSDADVTGVAGGTRLGDPTSQMVPVFDLSEFWSVDPSGTLTWDKREPIPSEIARRLAARHIRVHRHIVNGLVSSEIPHGWAESPFLETFVPVVFNVEGISLGERYRLCLSADLGLIIERSAS